MKTHQQKIEDIRKACIKANPEIVELKFGCVVTNILPHRSRGGRYVFTGKKGNKYIMDKHYLFEGGLYSWHGMDGVKEIIGRPIRLADVLLAWRNTSEPSTWWNPSDLREICTQWNLLKDNFEDQSEPTIDFLWSLLCKE